MTIGGVAAIDWRRAPRDGIEGVSLTRVGEVGWFDAAGRRRGHVGRA
ncbi:hypothetical protein [Gluconacetobacter sacchari]|uniref:Uncharacterized protein n=1 Tax=Gluconacetobacter sacchari TaxID=92759 RepID=A0A7W4NJ04_9PROT|nr:hypothetical protein [Gluconacetobacter sacchari]MBB2158637.1 hypothetical protein [Gluconacetobacter sacchari]